MKEEELLHTHQIGDVIDILQTTTHHLYDPDELLRVRKFSETFLYLGELKMHTFLIE